VEPAFLGMAIASGVHAAEEYVYPGGFLGWLRSIFPHSAPSAGQAVFINGAFFALVLSPVLSDSRGTPVLALSIAGLLLANGAMHVAGTLLTRRYSPGAVTSVLCYFPAAVYALTTVPAKWHMGGAQVLGALVLGCVWAMIPLAFMFVRR
jgi:hypothetical protein